MSLFVFRTSGYCPWSTWSRVGGWGIWQRPRQGWFLGQVHMHNSCPGWISCCHLSFVTCMNSGEKYFECTESPFCSVDHWNCTTVFCFSSFLSCTPPPYRTKLDLGIVKKSIVVDDVSEQFSFLSLPHRGWFFNHKTVKVCLNVSSQWFTLKDTDSGRVHFRLEWLSLLPSTDQLEQVWVSNFHWWSAFRVSSRRLVFVVKQLH